MSDNINRDSSTTTKTMAKAKELFAESGKHDIKHIQKQTPLPKTPQKVATPTAAQTPTETNKSDAEIKAEKLRKYGKVGEWFQLLCWVHIPIFGFVYMLVTALKKDTPEQKRSFAKAYVLYRILVLILALTILFVIYRVGLDFVDKILQYAGE